MPVTLTWKIRVEELSFNLDECNSSTIPSELNRFLESEQYIESNNAQIKEKAASLASGKNGPGEVVEVIYDYVIDNMTYVGYVPRTGGCFTH